MGLGDALNKAKEFAAQNPDKVEQGIDAAAAEAKKRVSDEHDAKIDQATNAAKDRLGLDNDPAAGQQNA